MKRRVILTFICLCLCFTLFAQNTINVSQKNGGVVRYSFDETPVATYVGDYMHVATSKSSIDYPLSNLEKITFSISTHFYELSTEGVNSDIDIYSVDGVHVKKAKAVCGNSSVDISDLPKGVYVVKTGKITYKISKK